MRLTSTGENFIVLKLMVLISMIAGAVLFIGCGGGEQAQHQEQGEQKPGQEAQKPNGEKPAEEKPMDQALTSFVGTRGKDTQAQTSAQPAQQAAVPANTLAAYEKQLEDLRTENTTLRQKIAKLEQDNRTLNARLSDTDAKIAAEKSRADRAEEALKNTATAANQPASKPAEGTPKSEPAKAEPKPATNITGYEDALKAFNSRKYADALQGFQHVFSAGVAEDMADNCKYWIGESQFALKKYKDAVGSFEDVIKYKASEKKGDAQFMLGQSFERLGNKVKAKEAYEKVVKDYPMSKNVKRAKERWAKL
ncbi:MAG: tetratricopeptide repeat protein [Ignavibacteriales bacterium]|nr:tetratricopeptide repeat protein [Ignavibacteriales bacterium]